MPLLMPFWVSQSLLGCKSLIHSVHWTASGTRLELNTRDARWQARCKCQELPFGCHLVGAMMEDWTAGGPWVPAVMKTWFTFYLCCFLNVDTLLSFFSVENDHSSFTRLLRGLLCQYVEKAQFRCRLSQKIEHDFLIPITTTQRMVSQGWGSTQWSSACLACMWPYIWCPTPPKEKERKERKIVTELVLGDS